MASGGDVADAVGDVTSDLTAALTLSDASARPTESTVTWLDMLPLEVLEKVASWLGWPSQLSLKDVSSHCRNAVGHLFGRVHAVELGFGKYITAHLKDIVGRPLCAYAYHECPTTDPTPLTDMMSQLTSLTVLHMHYPRRKRLRALIAASPYWTRLERLELTNWWQDHSAPSSLDFALLSELCANCPLLTAVTLVDCKGGDETVKAVVAARPGLRTLDVNQSCKGSFLSELPAGLRELSINSSELRSEAVAELARFSELRSLRLEQAHDLRAEHLKAGLAGCIGLERLALTYQIVDHRSWPYLTPSVINCLPAAGLPALRHLELRNCKLMYTDMGHLVERLPDLESICLANCEGLITPDVVAHLGRLSALRSVKLEVYYCSDSISDKILAKLSSAPLVELELASWFGEFSATPEGLLQLTRTCPTLNTVILRSFRSSIVRRIECGRGDKGDLQQFKNALAEVKQPPDSDSDDYDYDPDY